MLRRDWGMSNMVKLLLMLLILALMFAVTACDDVSQNIFASAPDNKTQNDDSPENSNTPVYEDIERLLEEGTYEGELDENGRFTGWGIWLYHNFRYEGYFVDGLPYGEGVLSRQSVRPADLPSTSFYNIVVVTQGVFVDGYVHGPIAFTYYLDNGSVLTWRFDVDMGVSTIGEVIADNGISDLTLSTSRVLITGGVPPFAEEVETMPEIEAPDSISNLP